MQTPAILYQRILKVLESKDLFVLRSSNPTIRTHIACKKIVRNIMTVSLKKRVGIRHPMTWTTKKLHCCHVQSQIRNYSKIYFQMYSHKRGIEVSRYKETRHLCFVWILSSAGCVSLRSNIVPGTDWSLEVFWGKMWNIFLTKSAHWCGCVGTAEQKIWNNSSKMPEMRDRNSLVKISTEISVCLFSCMLISY